MQARIETNASIFNPDNNDIDNEVIKNNDFNVEFDFSIREFFLIHLLRNFLRLQQVTN